MRLLVILISTLLLLACGEANKKPPPLAQSAKLPAGSITLPRVPSNSYIQPGKGLDGRQKLNFWTGFSLFRDPWVIAPSSTTDRDGLGPLFNTRSCTSCHTGGSRGRMSLEGTHVPNALVLRLGSTIETNAVDFNYGGQIQPRSIDSALPPEAKLTLHYEVISGQYPDGSGYQLQKPELELAELGYGPLSKDIKLSPRYSPNIYGMGLLDAISEQDLLNLEDIVDQDGDGISAKYNRVDDVETGKIAIGRFGLKAKQPNLKQQVAAAFRDDIGITNALFPEQNCSESQDHCRQLEQATGLEINDKLLDLVMDFSRYIGVPPARNIHQPAATKGRQWFHQVGCAGCHTPSFTTDKNYPIEALANVTIWPYTDLALHDMGDDLADGVKEYSATGQEWRTPPLWGIGLQAQFLKNPRYLHDGRARTIEEAILWHGGEAQLSKMSYTELTKEERDALLFFVESL